jgi:hypothetical protein
MSYSTSKPVSVSDLYEMIRSINLNSLENNEHRIILQVSFRDDSQGDARQKNMRRVTTQYNSTCSYLDIMIIDPSTGRLFKLKEILVSNDELEKCRWGISPLGAPNRYGNDPSILLAEIIEGRIDELDTDTSKPLSEVRRISSDAIYSKLFLVSKIICKVFEHEAETAFTNGKTFIEFLIAKKKDNKDITPQDALIAYNEAYPNIHSSYSLIISEPEKKELFKSYQKGTEFLLKELLVIPVKKVSKFVSGDTIASGEKPQYNGYVSVKLKSNQTDGTYGSAIDEKPSKDKSSKVKKSDTTIIYDLDASLKSGKMQTISSITNSEGDEEVLTFNNIHELITEGTRMGGVFTIGCCASQTTISISLKASKLSIRRNTSSNNEEDDYALLCGGGKSENKPLTTKVMSLLDEGVDVDSEFGTNEGIELLKTAIENLDINSDFEAVTPVAVTPVADIIPVAVNPVADSPANEESPLVTKTVMRNTSDK